MLLKCQDCKSHKATVTFLEKWEMQSWNWKAKTNNRQANHCHLHAFSLLMPMKVGKNAIPKWFLYPGHLMHFCLTICGMCLLLSFVCSQRLILKFRLEQVPNLKLNLLILSKALVFSRPVTSEIKLLRDKLCKESVPNIT